MQPATLHTAPATAPLPGAWGRIDWSPPVPDHFLIPEHHYRMRGDCSFLTPVQRVRLNHLAVRFSCESFVHFERYVIEYLERYPARLGPLPERRVRCFIDEERVHVDAFYTALERLRPDLHSGRRLRMHRWTWVDRLLLRLSPSVSFFLLAALFEEMTLYVPVVMDERPEESYPPLHAVMRLHAKEERGHVALDERVLAHAAREQPRWRVGLQVLLMMGVMACVGMQMNRAWRRGVEQFAQEEGLTARQRRALLGKRLSTSDELGIKAFSTRLANSPLCGARLLRAVLDRLT
ncbi:diiron oxygenase [Myxococcaceae bacterium GXIMD 01537]